MKGRDFVLLAAFLMTNTIFGATFYVSTTGSDSNTGSVTAPFATFSKVVSVMSAEILVLLKEECIEKSSLLTKMV